MVVTDAAIGLGQFINDAGELPRSEVAEQA